MKIILLGAPGSGKGTQGDLLTKTYGFPRISTGDLLRDAVALGTPLGQEAKAIMKRGNLVADDLVVKMVEQRITKSDCAEGYILDGFPRTISQAHMMENINQNHSEVVIEISLPDQVVVNSQKQRISAMSVLGNSSLCMSFPEQTLQIFSVLGNSCRGMMISLR
jgi:adenylate kinase